MKPSKMNNAAKTAVVSLIFNIAYAAANLLLGVLTSTWWFMTVGTYYVILGSTRVCAVNGNKKQSIAPTLVGVMLMITSLPLLGMAILCSVRDVGTQFHEIVMIAIALYAFIKLTLAVISLIRAKKRNIVSEKIIRNVSLADALVSIASLQRSMLVSFGEMSANDIRIFNILTGSAVCLLVFLLGLDLLKSK